MKYLVFFALIAVVAAMPMPGYLSELDLGGHGLDYAPSYSVDHAAPLVQAAEVVHAAPIIHAPIVAKQATSYSSFKRVIHPITHHVAPVVHAAPVIESAPIVHAPVIESAPLLSIQSHEPISYGHSLGHGYDHGYDHGYGHGYGHGW